MKHTCRKSFGLKEVVRGFVVGLCFFAGAVLGMAQTVIPSTNAAPVLFVNQQPVSPDEFVWFMQQERAGVFQYFKQKFNLDSGTNFWGRELPGGSPRALLRQRTVERIVREKVQQLLFQKLGLVEDIRYESFVNNLEKLNDQRESSVRQGQVVYGPVRYTQLQYYMHWMAGLRLRATEQLAQDQWNVSDSQVNNFYEQNKEKFQIGETSTLEMVTLQASNSETSAESLQAIARNIVSALNAGADLKTAVQKYAGNIQTTWQRFDEMNDGRIGEVFAGDEPAKKILRLAPGQGTWLPVSKDEIRVIRCISKIPGYYPSFEEIKPRVKSIYLDQLYDQLIDESVKKADVQLTHEAMESLLQ